MGGAEALPAWRASEAAFQGWGPAARGARYGCPCKETMNSVLSAPIWSSFALQVRSIRLYGMCGKQYTGHIVPHIVPSPGSFFLTRRAAGYDAPLRAPAYYPLQ